MFARHGYGSLEKRKAAKSTCRDGRSGDYSLVVRAAMMDSAPRALMLRIYYGERATGRPCRHRSARRCSCTSPAASCRHSTTPYCSVSPGRCWHCATQSGISAARCA
ncbi:unnamed protein product [Mycetohabitans rhizoxinica HKI 454]|uniref:Uncharacterized protein n=1 Tax=Mycetohabitans rhizoxinica (strain DSM 19002 / CIP 109453 / HKI 454) TaxID=882378 RepID=E5AQ79_MYCRK|nr:unnamed protein product [Mycetohabitans rhizoxinica HKI 454]